MSLLSIKLLVVLSASMGASLPVGSLAVVMPQEEYFVGGMVTFKIPGSDELLTHRIVEVSAIRAFKTRGDANNVVDDWELVHGDIVGKVIFHISYLGYLLRLPQILLTVVAGLFNPTG